MSLNIEQLKAELVAKANSLTEQTIERAEVEALKAQLNVLNSEEYQEAKTKQAINKKKQSVLSSAIETCKAVISTMPIYNTKTRQDKKWAGRPTYGLGKDIELLHELCSGVLYSVEEHKTLMCGQVGLDISTVEEFLTSLGNTAYYSTNYSTIVEEIPYDVARIKEAILLLGEQLGIVIEDNTINETNMAARFEKARIKAEKDKLEDDTLDTTTHFTMN